jgi:hypothetical protein
MTRFAAGVAVTAAVVGWFATRRIWRTIAALDDTIAELHVPDVPELDRAAADRIMANVIPGRFPARGRCR